MNKTKLEEKIKQSGLKRKYIASKLGITYAGFKKKVDGKSDFFTKEIEILCDLLNINNLEEKEEIFFK